MESRNYCKKREEYFFLQLIIKQACEISSFSHNADCVSLYQQSWTFSSRLLTVCAKMLVDSKLCQHALKCW